MCNLFKKICIILSCYFLPVQSDAAEKDEKALYVLPHLRKSIDPPEASYSISYEEYEKKLLNQQKIIFLFDNFNEKISTKEDLFDWLNEVQLNFKDQHFTAISFTRSLYEIYKKSIDTQIVKCWFADFLTKNPSWMDEWFQLSKDHFKDFDERHFSNTIYALMQLCIKPNEEWLKEWYSQTQHRMAAFNSQEWANMLSGLSLLQEHDLLSLFPDRVWMDAIFSESLHKIDLFTPDTYQSFFMGFCEFGVTPDLFGQWILAFFNESLSNLSKFEEKTTYTMLSGLTESKVKINDEWLNTWYSINKDQLNGYSPKWHSRVLLKLGMLRKNPPLIWMNSWYTSSMSHMDNPETCRLSNRDIADNLYAHVLMKTPPLEGWMTKIKSEMKSRKFENGEDKRQIVLFETFFKTEDKVT